VTSHSVPEETLPVWGARDADEMHMDSLGTQPPAPHYRDAVAAGRRARARPLRRLAVGAGGLVLGALLIAPFLMPSSKALSVGDTGMLLSTSNDVNSPSGVPGLDSWLKGTVLVFGDPGLDWEPTGTTGTFDLAVALEAFGAGDTNGVHLVERPVTVGSSPSMDLQPGDLLFTLAGDDNLTSTNSISAKKADIVMFRPDTPGDYTAGTFAIVLENPAGAEVRGFTLVEATTDVGDVPVAAGSFLLTQRGGSEHSHVYLYVPTGTGAGTTTGVQSILLSKDESGIDQKIWGFDLMEEDQGGVLTAGSILVTLDASDQVGTADNVSADPNDVFVLHAVGSGPALVTAEVVFFGADVGLTDPIDAIGFLAANRPPAFDQDLGNRTDAEGAVISLPAPANDPDGDTLAYSVTGLPPGLSIDSGTGLISGTIDNSGASSSPFATEIRTEDPGGLFDVDTFTWTVTEVPNLAPVFDQDLLDRVAAEGDLITLPSPATDPDGDTLAYSAIGLPPGLSIDPNTGSISGTVSVGATAGSPYAVTIRAEDPDTAFDTDMFSWAVMLGSASFQSGSDGYAGTEDTMLAEALANTAYGNYSSVRVDLSAGSFGSGETQGLVRFDGIVGSGPSQISPGSTVGSATLIVWVNDGGAGTVSLHRVLQPWSEASTWNSLVGGIQTDGVEAAIGPEAQHIDTAAMGYQSISDLRNSVQAWVNGADNFGWALFSDSMIGWEFYSSEYATVSVRPRLIVDFLPNQAPAFDQNLTNRTHAEGTVISLSAAATDPEGHGIAYSATGLPPGLSIDPVTGLISGTVTYTAAAGSPYSVAVMATDDYTAASMDTFAWTVTEFNRPPVVTNPGDRFNTETDPVTSVVAGSDPDGDGLTWTSTGLPDGLTIDPLTGVISGTISYDGATGSPHPVTVRATDDGAPNLFDEVAFTWTVANVNRGPNVNHPGHQAVAEGDGISLFMTATDPDGDGFTWSATGLPDGLSVDPVTGEISGTVGFGAAISSPFNSTITATDDGAPSASGAALVDWTVTSTNRAPVVTDPGAQVSDENDVVNLPITGLDPDGDGVVWSAVGLPTGLSINPASGVISGIVDYAAAAGSPYAVTVTLTDDGVPVLSGQATFSWTVNDVNRPPMVTNPGDQSDAEGDPVNLPITGSDLDGDGLTWTAAGLPPGLSINPSTGVISGTLTYTSAGIFPVAVRATDDGAPNLFDEVVFPWTVADTNRPPLVTDPGPRTSAEVESVSLLMAAIDPELDGFTWSVSGLPGGLAIDPVTGLISGDVAYGAASGSPYTVTVTATDDGAPVEAGDAVLIWIVTDLNRGPLVADPGTQTNRSGDLVSLTMTAVDPDGDGFTWSATGLPPGLSIDPISGEISGFAGADGLSAVTVTATDDGFPVALTEMQFMWAVADDLTITKVSDAGGAAAMGQAVTYTMTVDNPGLATHTGVAITDPLPAGTSWVSTQVTYPVDGAAGTVSDNWDTWDYTGSTGTIPWSTDWVETGDDGNPTGGKIHIHDHDGRRLLELEEGEKWITRNVDLAGYASATLSYEFRRHSLKDSGDVIVVEVSADGVGWTEVARHAGPGDDDWQVKAPPTKTVSCGCPGWRSRRRREPRPSLPVVLPPTWLPGSLCYPASR